MTTLRRGSDTSGTTGPLSQRSARKVTRETTYRSFFSRGTRPPRRRPPTPARAGGDAEHAHRLQTEAEALAAVGRGDVQPAEVAHALEPVADRVPVGEQARRRSGRRCRRSPGTSRASARGRSRTARRRRRAARPSRRRSAAARPGPRSWPAAAGDRRRSRRTPARSRARRRRRRAGPRRRWPPAAPRWRRGRGRPGRAPAASGRPRT